MIFPLLQDEAPKWEDERGYLQVLYESEQTVLKRSFSRAGVFRGLHVQDAPSPQIKIIRVVSGRIIDFVVSTLDRSATIHRRELCAEDGWVRIDAHYAHGFFAIEDTVFEYICDGQYHEASERAYSIAGYLKAELGLADLILSDKDRASKELEPGNGWPVEQ